MPTVKKTAVELIAGDLIDFAGVEFVLLKSSVKTGRFISLDFNSTTELNQLNSDMFIDCLHTVPFNVIIK